MLQQLDLALVDTDRDAKKDLELVQESKKKHQNRLKQIDQIIKTKQDLQKAFTLQQLDDHTSYVQSFQDNQSAKTLAHNFVKFLSELKVPLQMNDNQIHNHILNIVQLPSTKTYQKEVVQFLQFRLRKYQNQLDKNDDAIISKLSSSNQIPLTFSHGASGLKNEQQILDFSNIVVRDAILYKCFSQLHSTFESTLLRSLFMKLYDTTRKTTVLSEQYNQKEIQLIFKHIKALFQKNNSMFKNILGNGIGYSYTVKELYMYLVANNTVEILGQYKQKLSKQQISVLVQKILKLQLDIKGEVHIVNEKYLTDNESVLNLIYQKHPSVFSQILSQEQASFKTNILQNPKVANSDNLEDLQNANQAFKNLLTMYYSKYQHSTSKYKQKVNQVYSSLVKKMLGYLKVNISRLIALNRSDTNRQLKYSILEYANMIEYDFERNEIIDEIKKSNKGLQDDLVKFKTETNSLFVTLVNQEYSSLKKTIYSESKQLEKLFKQKEHNQFQKRIFLKRMRMLFFKFLREQELTKDKIKKLARTFEPFLQRLFPGRYKEILKVIQTGTFANDHKELMFLDKEERVIMSQVKINY